VFTLNNRFYQAFEERHRGSRELIKQRLNVYLPFVKQLHELYPDGQALDLGCGRGEWLELLNNINIPAHGIDLNEGMLSYCRERGLSVTTGDAVAILQALPDDSQMIVSGFHIAEHLPFSDLQILIHEAMRVLKPAGLLILETPNPENLVVGTASFYIDPTHQRPIPQPLLAFLSEYYGFSRTKVMRLQESPELLANPAPTLLNVLNGVSPDYAIIAQKDAQADLLAALDELFSKEFGISVETLATRYETHIQQNFTLSLQLAQQAIQHAEGRIYLCEKQIATQQAENQRLIAETSIQAINQQQLEAQLAEAAYALHRYAASLSWRLTLPLRIMTRPLRKISRSAKSQFRLPRAAKSNVKEKNRPLLHAKRYIYRRPRLKRVALAVLSKFPAVKRRLRLLFAFSAQITTSSVDAESVGLSPRAARIYADLQKAIAARKN
jgi:O-antigen chain-terminating methyltransferase